MDIRCERCATEYELEEASIPDAGLTLKCATCGHVFKVMKTASGGISLKLYRGGDPVSAFCPDSATLQRWIIEQRVLRDDEIAFSGQPWRKLGEVPELSAFFALLSMPPPVLRIQPTPMGTPPVVAAPLPAPPPVVAPPPVAAPVVVPADQAATQQVTITPEMFAPPAPPPAPSAPSPEVARVAELPTQPAMAPVAAPKPAPAPAAAPPAPRPTPAPKPKKKPVHEDPDIAAIVNKGRTSRVLTIVAVVALAVSAAAYVLFFMDDAPKGPSQQARLAYRRGHDLYLTDTIGNFQNAEDAYKRAVEAAGKDGYPEAQGGLAELRVAWAEQLQNRNNALVAEAKTAVEAGNKEEEEKLLKKANGLATDAQAKLTQAMTDINRMQAAGTLTTEAQRAALDYARLANDPARANTAVEALKAVTDPETQAHVAMWLSMDPAQRAGAESSLKDLVQRNPDFIRARWWLADLHLRSGDTAAALADAQEVLKAAPNHALAKPLVDAQEKAAAALAAATADAGPTTAAMTPPPQKGGTATIAKAPPAPAKDPAPAPAKDPAPAPAPVKDPPVAKAPPTPAPVKDPPVAKEPPGGFNVDAAVEQAAAFLDKKKPKKAIELYDRILAAKPRLTDALYGRAVALQRLNRAEEAIAAYKKTLEVNPRFGDAMFDLGETYRKAKDTKNAAKYFQQYIDTFPTGAQAKAAKAAIAGMH